MAQEAERMIGMTTKKTLSFSTFVSREDVRQTTIRDLIDIVLKELERGFSLIGLIPDYSSLNIITSYDEDFNHVQICASMKGN